MVMPRKKDPIRICKACGKPLKRKRMNGRLEDLGVFSRRVYCNRSCMAQGYVKDAPRKGTYHQRARKLRGKSCENCGSTRYLAAHHIDGNWKNNSPKNIQTLCAKCHAHHHHRAASAGLTVSGRMECHGLPPEYLTECKS